LTLADIVAGTSDTEAVMNTLMRLMKEKSMELGGHAEFNGCVDHLLELTTSIAFDNTPHSENTMAKARALCGHFTGSTQAAGILLLKQVGGDKIAVGCIQDVVTRWWSTYQMAHRLIRLKLYFALMVAEGSLAADTNLSPDQWIILEDTVAVLEPFMVAQRILEGEKYVTISLVLIIITTIRSRLMNVIEKAFSQHQFELATALLEDFNIRWGSGTDGTVFNEHLTLGLRNRPKGIPRLTLLATFVDPRTKSMTGLGNIEIAQVRQAIKSMAVEDSKLVLQCH